MVDITRSYSSLATQLRQRYIMFVLHPLERKVDLAGLCFLKELANELGYVTTRRTARIIRGEVIPSPEQIPIIIRVLGKYGVASTPRDFTRGTAASNNSVFVLLRTLRHVPASTFNQILESVIPNHPHHERAQ